MREIPFVTVDVFTNSAFTGNPLAVITDGRSLSSGEMQQIAREFNFSETTFVLPPKDPSNTAHVRIFDPANELPFAGHPNVGTGYVVAQARELFGKPVGDALRFEEVVGIVPLTAIRENNELRGIRFRVPGSLEILESITVEHVAACIGLDINSIVTANHEPLRASVGLPFAFAEVDSLESLAIATPDTGAFAKANRAYPSDIDMFALFIYVRTSADPLTLQARMFAPLSNIPEDPATGSASAALGALLVSLEDAPDVERPIVINQGVEMGRPSRIQLEVAKRSGIVTDVFVSGNCALVTRGTLSLQD